jgi:hypothetical protein
MFAENAGVKGLFVNLSQLLLSVVRTCNRLIAFISTLQVYGVIHKSVRDFRPLGYSSRDGHAEGEHVNRGRDTPSFCPTLKVLDMCTLGDAADVNPVPIKFLRHALQRSTSRESVRIE